MLDTLLCPIALAVEFESCLVGPPFSEYPESCGGRTLFAPDVTEPPLCLSVFPMISKNDTGTNPRALGIKGLQASYQSGSFSRLMTWKKSPLWKANSWVLFGLGA